MCFKLKQLTPVILFLKQTSKKMASVQIISDIHLEAPKSYDVFEITPIAPYLALIGDVGCVKDPEYFSFLEQQLSKFGLIFVLLGNHEPYHSSYAIAKKKLQQFEQDMNTQNKDSKLGKLVFMDQTRFDLSPTITILGCTLFSNILPSQLESVSFGINDFYHIEDWTVEQHNEAHTSDIEWLNAQVRAIAEMEPDRKVIILTHHSPTTSSQAVDPAHAQSKISSGFSSDLSGQPCWTSGNVKVWAFGHTHFNCDFVDGVNGKRVVANQRGYYFILTSVAGGIGIAWRTSKLLYELIEGTIDAPSEVLAVASEVKAFAVVLLSLQQLIQDGGLQEEAMVSLQAPLDNCQDTLTALTVKIQPHIRKTGEAKKSKWRGLTWTFKKDEARNLCNRLAHNKMTLNTVINIMNSSVASQNRKQWKCHAHILSRIKLEANANQVGDRIHLLQKELKARDDKKVVLASVDGRRGSESIQTDGGFALRRFLENESVFDLNLDSLSIIQTDLEATNGLEESTLSNINELETESPDTRSIVGENDSESAQNTTSALFEAVENSDLLAVQTQLDLGASINAVDQIGYTPLHYATEIGSLEIVQTLIERGCEIDERCESSEFATSLHLAVVMNRVEITKAFLEAGADINSKVALTGHNVLQQSVKKGSLACFQLLLDYGADTNIRTDTNCTLLQVMLGGDEQEGDEGDKFPLAKLLIEHRVSCLNEDQTTTPSIFLAARKGFSKITRLLLDNGADANARYLPDLYNVLLSREISMSRERGLLSLGSVKQVLVERYPNQVIILEYELSTRPNKGKLYGYIGSSVVPTPNLKETTSHDLTRYASLNMLSYDTFSKKLDKEEEAAIAKILRLRKQKKFLRARYKDMIRRGL
ncbi:hypothetical protein G7Y89_g11130 [Cudoniella acicularis]|uniref:Calcineurin-like phosphoesterase domain-containing protein n=1 Tax=Cudoniella acicularis TaxID=354080 RepID=A0A8H4VYB3_9HELO|nr:hypothetical protein G7Y89_g11130 [Cudoniella acicularis]